MGERKILLELFMQVSGTGIYLNLKADFDSLSTKLKNRARRELYPIMKNWTLYYPLTRSTYSPVRVSIRS
jgi:hypothetical protein